MNELKLITLIEKNNILEKRLNELNKNIISHTLRNRTKTSIAINFILVVSIFLSSFYLFDMSNTFYELYNKTNYESYMNGGLIISIIVMIGLGMAHTFLITLIYQTETLLDSSKKIKYYRMKLNKRYRKKVLKENKEIKKIKKEYKLIEKEWLENNKEIRKQENNIEEMTLQEIAIKKIVKGELNNSINYWLKRLNLSEESLEKIKYLKVKKVV